jgi:hypothetical protein
MRGGAAERGDGDRGEDRAHGRGAYHATHVIDSLE